MSTYSPSPSPQAYRANAVLTASQGQLVVMLYDGARRFLTQGAAAMSERQIPLAHQKLSGAENIIRHLRVTLDMEQGQMSARLEALYAFWEEHLRRARIEQNPAKLTEVNEMMGRLRESWATIAAQ